MVEDSPSSLRNPSRPTWKMSEEVGSLWGIVFVAELAKWAGRSAARFFVFWLAAYFYLTRPERVAACVEFRARAGAGTSPLEVFRHFLVFAHCALDRLYFLSGRHELFRYFLVGHNYIQDLAESQRGAILVGAHLGSFEALRAASRKHKLDLLIVADFQNARRLNAILSQFGDNEKTRFLDASGDRVTLGLEIKEAVGRGGLVAILADRAGHGRTVEVEFLGKSAHFPVGPYLLASLVECPVYFTTAFYSPPRRYELLCEPFAESISLPRGAREEALRSYAEKYARRLEHYARMYPENWFNFYPFWSETDLAPGPDR